MLDLGYGFRAIAAKLAELGVSPAEVSAVVITHEHSDHISALANWTKHFGTPIFAPPLCCNHIAQTCFCSEITPVGGAFELGDVWVEVYKCSHDARQCFGYRFSDDEVSAASVTDTGVADELLTQFLSPCRKVILESNHDVQMLKESCYPYPLKQRILSSLGHLSNAQAGEVLASLAGTHVQKVVLAHLSQQNNTAALALSSAKLALKNIRAEREIEIFVADQYKNEVTI